MVIRSQRATEYNILSQNRRASRQFKEIHNGLVTLSSDGTERVVRTAKSFNVKQSYGFNNRNNTHEDIFVN